MCHRDCEAECGTGMYTPQHRTYKCTLTLRMFQAEVNNGDQNLIPIVPPLSSAITIHPRSSSPIAIHPHSSSPITIPPHSSLPIVIPPHSPSPITISPHSSSPIAIPSVRPGPVLPWTGSRAGPDPGRTRTPYVIYHTFRYVSFWTFTLVYKGLATVY